MDRRWPAAFGTSDSSRSEEVQLLGHATRGDQSAGEVSQQGERKRCDILPSKSIRVRRGYGPIVSDSRVRKVRPCGPCWRRDSGMRIRQRKRWLWYGQKTKKPFLRC